MEFLDVVFPVSGVQTNLIMPPLVALVVSFLSSLGGLSGAFLLLPYQMSVLGYTSPSVSATNFVYNIVAIPGGIYRFVREGRMLWPLAWLLVLGTMPGVFVGFLIRVHWLPDAARFKLFVGVVLLYISVKLIYETLRKKSQPGNKEVKSGRVRLVHLSAWRMKFSFMDSDYEFGTLALMALSAVVGVIGGIYGIGGGAIIAPFLVAVLRLPVHAIAGATLFGTFMTSIVGVAFYSLMPSDFNTLPDWKLGLLIGAGGFVGIYLGARAQKHVPQREIKILLGLLVLGVALKYIIGYFV